MAPPNSIVLVRGRQDADIPASGEPVAHTDTCVSVGTLMEHDGETTIRLMAAGESSEHPHPALEVFDGTLVVRGGALVVAGVTGAEYLSLPCRDGEVAVRVYTNHSTEPDEIHVVVGWPVVTVAWDDGTDQLELESDDPRVAMDALHALDGRRRTLVTVERGASHLGVGGDAATGLVVYLSREGETFLQLTTGQDDDTPVTVLAGAQPGQYPRHDIVDAAVAEQAVRAFLARGDADPRLPWRPT